MFNHNNFDSVREHASVMENYIVSEKALSLRSWLPLLLSNMVYPDRVILTLRLSVFSCVVLISLDHHLFFSRHAKGLHSILTAEPKPSGRRVEENSRTLIG